MTKQVKNIDSTIEGSFLKICINREQKRNALNDLCLEEIEHIFTHLSPKVKCIILSGSGEHFSAGLDLSELTNKNAIDGFHHSRMWHRVMDLIQFGQVPVIALLQGACIGGGLELAMACHIRVAEESTFYALPEAQRGIYVGGGASVRLPQAIGLPTMMDMLLTGRVYGADEGYKLGFSQYLVESSTGMSKAMEIAEKIASNTSMTNFAITQVLPRIQDSTREAGLMMESLVSALTQESAEAKERLNEFLQGYSKKITRDQSSGR